jgi:TonB family protein
LPEGGVPDNEYHGPPTKAWLGIVRVEVNPDGSMKSAKMYQSTAVEAYDRTALADARRGVYLPKQIDCKNVEGTYMFEELFPGPP